jgi:hypothetical protein
MKHESGVGKDEVKNGTGFGSRTFVSRKPTEAEEIMVKTMSADAAEDSWDGPGRNRLLDSPHNAEASPAPVRASGGLYSV